jgi:hypothetical protein
MVALLDLRGSTLYISAQGADSLDTQALTSQVSPQASYRE